MKKHIYSQLEDFQPCFNTTYRWEPAPQYAPRDRQLVILMDVMVKLEHISIDDSDKMSCIKHWKYFNKIGKYSGEENISFVLKINLHSDSTT